MLFSGERPRVYEDCSGTLGDVAPVVCPARNDLADLIALNFVCRF